MIQKEDNSFDHKIRSILEQGREDVPEGIWDAVSGKLDEIEAGKKKRVLFMWLRYAGVASVAAAITLAVLFSGLDFDRQEPSNDAVQIAVIPNDSAVLSDESEVTSEIEAASLGDRTAWSGPIATVPEQEAIVAEQVVTASKQEGDVSEQETTIQRQEGDDKIKSSEETINIQDDWSDVEDASFRTAKKARTAVVISGTAAGNASFGNGLKESVLPMRPMGISSVEPNSLIENSESKFALPLSFGIGTKIIFTPRWSMGIGINYTLLSRTFSGTYVTENQMGGIELNKYNDIRNNQSYIGIPVDVYFSIIRKHFIDFYVYAGGTVEKCVSNRSYIKAVDIVHKEKVKGLQFSANAGLGVEFLLVDQLGIYIDPSLRYYFKGSQPKSIRTQQPLSFGCEIGLRVRL